MPKATLDADEILHHVVTMLIQERAIFCFHQLVTTIQLVVYPARHVREPCWR